MGKTQPLFTNWQLALDLDQSVILRDLLTQIVRNEVASFEDQQKQRRLIQVLTPKQISLGLEQGKVDLGGSDLAQAVDVDQAIAAALEAFTDGLYFVFLDDQQQENLDDVVTLRPDSQLMFLRLVPLVGG